MKKKFSWKKILLWGVTIIVGLHLLMFVILYFFQEKLLFRPDVLTKNHTFAFTGDFDEVYIPVEDNVDLHGLLFKSVNPKGLVFYLHGNGGSLDGWGRIAEGYISSGYDLFMLDYRGYGKSGGYIESEEQVNSDVDKAYAFLKKQYEEQNIIISGYSIGTGFATRLAAGKNIKALILQAPYYSMSMLISDKAPVVPEFVKRYKIPTYKYLEKVSAPVYMFHGTADELIGFSHAKLLLKHAKPTDVLVAIKGEGHNIKDNEILKEELKKILR